MTSPLGNREVCFREQNSLFPSGPVIKLNKDVHRNRRVTNAVGRPPLLYLIRCDLVLKFG